MSLQRNLRFTSLACACLLWAIACGGGDSPTGAEGGKGGSSAKGDAGPDGAQSEGGSGGNGAREDAGPNDGQPGPDGGESQGGRGGAGGSSAQGGGGVGGQGGGSSGEGGSGEVETSALHIDSFAPSGAEVGGVFRYRVVLDQAGPASFELTDAPEGATIDENGLVIWTPSFNQGGEAHSFTVKATLADEEIIQDFTVAVTALTISAEELLDPDSAELQIISVSSPLSGASGVSLTVPPGALSAASTISIATTSGAPFLPAQSSSGEAPLVLGFGPSGSVFNSPIDLVIPLSSAALQRILAGQTASAWTLGSDGLWRALPITYVDLENGYVQIKLQHFSLVGLMTSPALLAVDSAQLGAASCPNALFVKAGFTAAASSEPGAERWLNGADISGFSADSRLAELIGMVPAGHSVQLRLRAVLSAAAGDKEVRQYQLFNFLKRADGLIDVLVTSDGGNVLYSTRGLAADSGELEQVLRGEHTQFVFHDYPTAQDGQISLDAYAYVRWPDAPPILAGSEGQAFASLAQPFTYSTLSAGEDDDDCDGIVNDSDTTVTLALPPRVQPSTETTLRTTVNTAVTLAVSVVSEAADLPVVTWSSSSPAAQISTQPDGLTASFVTAMPGSYKVVATAQDSAGKTAQSFLVVVDSPVAPNTPPRCRINAKQTGLFTGEQIPLEAVLDDAEQPNQELSVEWRVSAGGGLSSSSERRVSFGAQAPAVYEVSCIARDGVSSSDPTSLTITVIDRPQNSPPRLSFVAPASATLQIPSSGLASQLIRVSATDLDNDPISIQFTLLEGDATLSLANSAASTPGTVSAARTFETAVPGPYAVLVRAVDQHNATSESVVIKLLVAQSLSGTDQDRDGFPASVDCNDSSASVFPGAREICGDGIDQNCNGSDQALADCDADRDGKTANDGDCDDNNPSVFPGAHERCNGRDDNCNAAIDEGYIVGADCSLGVGSCRVSGVMACSRDGAASVCNAKPAAPIQETCNGIDDNCNGTIDDVPTQGIADVNNCGGCGSVCTGGANQVPACMLNQDGKLGCAYICSAGFIDLDRNAQNGCEYSCAKPGKESCNGTDDDCDGRVDEQADAAFYAGPEGTLGVGECRSGLRICKQGVLVEAIAAVVPAAERCDMRDNNCDGKVDEGFELGGSCDGPDSDLCAFGRMVCSSDGRVVCGLEASQNLRDICDGRDNDCDPKTADGSADPQLNTPCDERNVDFCEPGRVLCTESRLLCSSEGRDRTSCRTCECDSSEACDTNGSGFYCSCDPQCTGPDVGCPCDLADGCQLLDDAEECGCDPACVGETVCGCDALDGQCDTAEGGFICGCDDDCGGTCGCDAAAGVCDRTAAGDACLCDHDCYPSCECDDRNPNTCPKDSSGNACECDPTCKAGGESCACDLTQRMCDVDSQNQPCACDLDCRSAECNCNSTSECDKAAAGDVCFCDADCGPACPCDDQDPMSCARDGNGNACQCDPGCFGGEPPRCECDSGLGVCNEDPSGNPCACDKDCGEPMPCECNTSSGACDKDAAGNNCVCDPECGGAACECDRTVATCDQGPGGTTCACDRDCGGAACECDRTPSSCDQNPSGGTCACDRDCAGGICECDRTANTCDQGPNGGACQCDKDCATMGCDCDRTASSCDQNPDGSTCGCDRDCGGAMCECDRTANTCDQGPDGTSCACDKDCGSAACECDRNAGSCDQGPDGTSCACDRDCGGAMCDCDRTPSSCDQNPDGSTCGCDRDCGGAMCECDRTANTCDQGPDGTQCGCDKDCGGVMCECDRTANTCDQGPDGTQCGCDKDCGGAMCECDRTANTCDQGPDGTSCACDRDCGGAMCDCDRTPSSCDQNPDGTQCGCDKDCGVAACECDRNAGSCDQGPNGTSCACDRDCGGAMCDCDRTPSSCDQNPDGSTCGCDRDCGGAMCECDRTANTCDQGPDGATCMCDRDCSTSACACDVSAETCDQNPGGDDCLCDQRCYPPCPCADDNPMLCHKDSDGNACKCDPGCEREPNAGCACDLKKGSCEVDPATNEQCACDVDCGAPPPACECDTADDQCDVATNGDACLCDQRCYPICPCDDREPATCARDSAGNACRCDPSCQSGPVAGCPCDSDPNMCDREPSGQACGCDPMCQQSTCECNRTAGTCDEQCGCDIDCQQNTCECNRTAGTCDEQCGCDIDCQQNTCECNRTAGTCDEQCGCDIDCQQSTCECNRTAGTCDEQCGCDIDCQQNTCECNRTAGTCDEQCGCDIDCQPSTCECDQTPSECDKTASGEDCACDADC